MRHFSKVFAFGAACAVLGGTAALSAAFVIKDPQFSNLFSRAGYGLEGTQEFDGTFILQRTGQRNGVSDTSPQHAALWVDSDVNMTTALRATAPGVDAVVGSNLPSASDADPAFGADGTPTLFVGDDGPLNTNGQKNGDTTINRVAVDARGAVKLCGKSKTGDAECTSQAYLYLEDGTGRLMVRFGNGAKIELAAPTP